MVSRFPAAGIVFIFFIFLYGFKAIGQPALPDFAGNVDKGVIVLSWNCQYNGVKSITVMRSADGLSNYSVIGNVENLEKGLQVFVDGHPNTGKNCYKLGIVFSSGLKWSSNSYCRDMEKKEVESSSGLPSNDSIQKLLVTQDVPGKSISPNERQKNSSLDTDDDNANDALLESARSHYPSKSEPTNVSVSFKEDAMVPGTNAPGQSSLPPQPRKKIVISFGEPDENSSHLIKSRFISIDYASGHIIMNLPDDVTMHHYSIRFFDDKNNLVTEIPKINLSKIIIDKRNFQKKGVYKFKLQRDAIELEAGFISVTPNP